MSDPSLSPRPQQLDLFTEPLPDGHHWPAPARFPHNEAGSRVDRGLAADLDEDDVLLVTGYASLDQVIRFLGRRSARDPSSVRILFGNEPFSFSRAGFPGSKRSMPAKIREYWLKRGISVLLSWDILLVREMVTSGKVCLRASPGHKSIHAKVYCSPRAVTLGSSNYTPAGLGAQSEANARFEAGDSRYDEAKSMAEGLWSLGADYRDGFLSLLDALLRAVTWQEALARGCAELLEGHWAKEYVPPEELATLDPPLWPHQIQGISQAVWTLHNLGSVLVADAAGSGKTRLGAWLLRAAHDRQVRMGFARRLQAVVVAPPSVVESWEQYLEEAGLPWKVRSHGLLSHETARGHGSLISALEGAELLAVDEAHNFVYPSGRTMRLQSHYSDNVVLFTATPINREASDLLGLIDLLGPDNFSDATLDVLERLQRYRRRGSRAPQEDIAALKQAIRGFMVRRTRDDLNACASATPAAYRLPTGRSARYPTYDARYYDLPASSRDLEIAAEITRLADRLKGVARLGRRLILPRVLAFEGFDEEDHLRRVIRASAALARHHVLDCLRSSRAALYEHVYGTPAAIERLALGLRGGIKEPTGNVAERLSALAGHPPVWAFASLAREAAPPWVWDPAMHSEACQEDRAIYEAIAGLAADLSGERESEKARLLVRLALERGQVIGFDWHVLTLAFLAHLLRDEGVDVECFTGSGGDHSKRRAMQVLGLGAAQRPLVALCSDAFSEGFNLQNASVVVHLDTPTVIRAAEQRAGRVDRMDSPHDRVEIWWPKDPPGFAPRRRDLLKERHELVTELIGANLKMPSDDADGELDLEEIVRTTAPDKRAADPQGLFDAFRPVRDLIGPDGLVSDPAYDLMCTSQTDVMACVGLVRSATPWAFFAVGGQERIAPRWVFLAGPGEEPLTDLAAIADALRARLSSGDPDYPLDSRAAGIMDSFLRQLARCERKLLPNRRQRALAIAERLLPIWNAQARKTADFERLDLLRSLERDLGLALEGQPAPDLRAVADVWLALLRGDPNSPTRGGRRGRLIWRRSKLIKELGEAPIPTDVLSRAFATVPTIAPVAERVVACILGIPDAASAWGCSRQAGVDP